jgi:hypothetical protein
MGGLAEAASSDGGGDLWMDPPRPWDRPAVSGVCWMLDCWLLNDSLLKTA